MMAYDELAKEKALERKKNKQKKINEISPNTIIFFACYN